MGGAHVQQLPLGRATPIESVDDPDDRRRDEVGEGVEEFKGRIVQTTARNVHASTSHEGATHAGMIDCLYSNLHYECYRNCPCHVRLE